MEELDLKELIELFWGKRIIIFLIVLIFLVLGVIYTIGFVTPKYTSTTKLVLATSENSAQTTRITATDVSLNSNLVSTYSELVKSNNVMRKVIANLGIEMGENDLKGHITVNSVKNTELIEISVTDEIPENAATIANEVAKVFIETVSEIYNINNVHVVDEAEVSENPSNIHHTKDLIVFAFGGLVLSIMYVLILNMLDTTVKTAEEVEKQFKVPVLASIPVCNYDLEKTNVKGGRRR